MNLYSVVIAYTQNNTSFDEVVATELTAQSAARALVEALFVVQSKMQRARHVRIHVALKEKDVHPNLERTQ